MLIGGAINMEEEEVKSFADVFSASLPYSSYWQFNQGQEWSYYPPTISALIERQWKHQKDLPEHSQQYVPVFWSKNSGDHRYKINIDLQIQYDIDNDSMVQIRRHPSAPQPIHSPNCPKCRFKISLEASICKICGTKLQPQLQTAQIKSHSNNAASLNHKNMISSNINHHQRPDDHLGIIGMDDDIKMILDKALPPITAESNAEKGANPFLQNDEVLCPSCCTVNKSDFNFCTKCGFNLKADDDPHPIPSAPLLGGGGDINVLDDMELDEKGLGMVSNSQTVIENAKEEMDDQECSAMEIDAPKQMKEEMNEFNAVNQSSVKSHEEVLNGEDLKVMQSKEEVEEPGISAMEFGIIGQTDIVNVVQEQHGNDENVEMDLNEETSNGEALDGKQSKEELQSNMNVESGKLEFAEYW